MPDFQSIVAIGNTVITGPIAVWLLTEVVKRAKSIPWITKDMNLRLRTLSLLLSAVAVVLSGVGNGTLDVTSLQSFAGAVLTALSVWGGSHLLHKKLGQQPPQE